MTYSRMNRKDSRILTKVPESNEDIEYEVSYSDELGIQYRAKDPSLFEYSHTEPERALHVVNNDVESSELLLRIEAFTKRITEEMSKNYITKKLILSSLNRIQNDIYFVTATCNVLGFEFNSISLNVALRKENDETKKEILTNLLSAAISIENMRTRLENLPS